MVKERMDLLELLRKGGMDGDVDFLREALRVLVEGIMDAEVSSRIGAGGILKKCVNSQAVYPLSEQHGLKARERRYTAHEEGKHWE